LPSDCAESRLLPVFLNGQLTYRAVRVRRALAHLHVGYVVVEKFLDADIDLELMLLNLLRKLNSGDRHTSSIESLESEHGS
jgi:hypothetical protein